MRMSTRGEETQHCDEERPRPVRFSIFGQIQQQQQQQQQQRGGGRDPFSSDHLHHHVSIKAENGEYVHDRYHDDEEDLEEDGGDQPLDFSAKKSEPKITAKVAVAPSNDHHLHHHSHFPTQGWTIPAPSQSSESGVSDLCSNSPQSDNEPPMPAKSPLGGSPVSQQPQQQSRMPQVPSPLPAALSAIYGPLAALQTSRTAVGGLDPAITAATTQLLTNLAAVTNGGKGGKNTRPFKAYPRDPMSLPLGLYGLPLAGNNVGDETVMTQASNDAYAEFRRQMLSQVTASKAKRKSINESSGNSRPNSVTGDSDDNTVHGHGNDSDVQEPTHIRGTVSVTDLRLVNGNDDDSEHSANDSIHVPNIKSPSHQMVGDLSGLSNSPSVMLSTTVPPPSATSGNVSGAKKRGRNGEEIKDEAYWERRRKNNEAAKRSRDARRAKEDEIAIRAAFLEQENLKLRFELANLKNETAKLRCMIYNS